MQRYIRHAFRLAFADDEDTLGEIELCNSKEDFEAIAVKIAESGVRIYFLLDQANTFDDEGGVSRAQVKRRREGLDWIDRVACEHFLILSSYKKAKACEKVAKMDFFGGLDKVCIKSWLALRGDCTK